VYVSLKISAKSAGNFFCNPANKLFAISHNGKEPKFPVLDPDADMDHRQNLTTSKLG